MKTTNFVVDKNTKKAIASFPSFRKAKAFQIQQNLLETSEIWGFDPAEMRPADKAKTLEIDIGKGYSLSVGQDTGNGVSIVLKKDGEMLQDLVVVEKVKGELPILSDAVAVYVWANEKDENYTHRLTIPFFKSSF